MTQHLSKGSLGHLRASSFLSDSFQEARPLGRFDRGTRSLKAGLLPQRSGVRGGGVTRVSGPTIPCTRPSIASWKTEREKRPGN